MFTSFSGSLVSRIPGAVQCVENGNIVSHYRIVCLQKNGAALINFVDARVTDGFILRDGEFVTSLQVLKEIGIKAGFSAFSEE
ncbi:TPA: hypothetical protein QHP23_004642 [Escherichia coli]|nr:hypothetical protein [Escherichia coli]